MIDAATPAWMNWSAVSERVTPMNGPQNAPPTMNAAARRSRSAANDVLVSRRAAAIAQIPIVAASTRITVADSGSSPVRSAIFEIT